VSRLRVRFSKLGKVRFTSHRDVARIWERSLRRGGVAVAYTEGFSPRPKLSFGLALSTGYESYGEYLDISLREGEPLGPDDVADRVAGGLPPGIEVQAAMHLPAGEDSLQQAVTSCTWHVDVAGVTPDDAVALLDRALAASELPVTRERKGQVVTDDVRPGILSARVLGVATDGPIPPDGAPVTRVEAELATQPRALRPSELVTAIAMPGPALRLARAIRINQWTLAGGARQEVIPLPAVATPPPHAEARAS
jgi:radical SAM-linked protein